MQQAVPPAASSDETQPAMRALALFRIGLGAFAWLAPRTMNRIFGVRREDESPALIYMNRVFGVRAISLGIGYLSSRGRARELWHRLWLLCDSADTAMGLGMAARGQLRPFTAAQALLITGGATAVDLAAMRGEPPESEPDTARPAPPVATGSQAATR
jgi:hypothetical protein